MDDVTKILESLALDPAGVRQQFLSLSSFFNIVLAGVMGYLVVVIYFFSSSRSVRDKNLPIVIPVLSILMAVIMRIQGAQAVLFFGIFGILSVIRFRSDLTDQKGITFILFAVIEGLLIGVNAYLMGILAWIVVGGAILLAKRIFNSKIVIQLTIKTRGSPEAARGNLEAWFHDNNIPFVFLNSRLSLDGAKKTGEWDGRTKLAYELLPREDSELDRLLPQFNEKLAEWNYRMKMKRLGE